MMINIIAHRGLWYKPSEGNSLASLKSALDNGFGIETDVRDHAGDILISHDMPLGHELKLYDLLAYCHKKQNPIMLNIKSDGLVKTLKKITADFELKNLFYFDMSFPDMRLYKSNNMPYLIRMSEFEQDLSFLDEAEGVWLDAFEKLWYTQDLIKSLLAIKKKVCIVSPELHGRDYSECWNMLKLFGLASYSSLYLCTDLLHEAHNFFHKGVFCDQASYF